MLSQVVTTLFACHPQELSLDCADQDGVIPARLGHLQCRPLVQSVLDFTTEMLVSDCKRKYSSSSDPKLNLIGVQISLVNAVFNASLLGGADV